VSFAFLPFELRFTISVSHPLGMAFDDGFLLYFINSSNEPNPVRS
jgi:hypothetical protein